MTKLTLIPLEITECWHSLSSHEVLVKLGVSALGLSTQAAATRLANNGLNELQEGKTINPWLMFFSQFNSLVIWILIVAGIISSVMGETLDAIAILTIVILNAIIGFYQEYTAEKSILALKKMTAPQAKVRRDGQLISIPAAFVVVGDILELEAGDLIAADARLLETASLRCMEAALTGESDPILKQTAVLSAGVIPLAERKNMLFMGGSIASGTGLAVVVATAMHTELGLIAGLIKAAADDQSTPLQRRLDAFGRILVWVALVIVVLLFCLGLLRGTPVFELTMTAISLAVAAVPEGLPAVVTVALSVGVLRMARRGALVRKLPAVETLGSTSVICTDKTGTLTLGQMTVRAFYVDGQNYAVSGEGYGPVGEVRRQDQVVTVLNCPAMQALTSIILGCNNAHLLQEEGVWKTLGDPTEGALLAAAGKVGGDRVSIELECPKQLEMPFDSDRKRSSVVRLMPDGKLRAFTNGAPGALLSLCTHLYTEAGIRPLTIQDSEHILAQTTLMANKALRVLASAYRDLEDDIANLTAVNVERKLVFVGLSGMYDPPRPEAKSAVEKCHTAGIRVVMITGDHPHTAMAIAKEIGIASDKEIAITGLELDQLSDTQLQAQVAGIAVFARVTAANKLRIIRAWKANDAVVAMAGDGVNDAPAIRGADIGITMGKSGTEVTKQAADMILTDDNFATIVAAVEEGRGIYENIRKTLLYLLAGGSGELLLMTICVLAGLPAPLLPIHLLWINLVTDGLPALCLATEPIDADLMKYTPRRRSERMTNPRFFQTMLLTGMLTAGIVFAVYVYALQSGNTESARSYAFAGLVFAELLRSFGARHERKPVWRLSLFTNINLVMVVVVSLGLQVLSQHYAPMERILKTTEMSLQDCLLLLVVSAIPLLVLELLKQYRHAKSYQPKVTTSYLSGFTSWLGNIGLLVTHAVKKFVQINASQSAAAFAYFAFFSLFPMILLFVTFAALFIDREQAGMVVITYIKTYIPIGADMQGYLFNSLTQVVKTSGPVSVVALVTLLWSAIQFFTNLITATNQAWGDVSGKWWQLPLQSLLFLALMLCVLMMGITAPVLVGMMERFLLPIMDFGVWFNPLMSTVISSLLVFFSLSLFYRIVPVQPTPFSQVWASALCTTLLLQVTGGVFALYLAYFTNLNAIYGAFGGIMALLLWLYVSGCIFIFGACLSSGQALKNTMNQ
ncbi:HAD-IC family P-type ATPase [Methylomonas sp. AM2-LC]|uniref:HAD-IC family P-type ATPase n=1 Tax=Methylomonas sp. AM2-LC TaxID=3153301 RepID=UPI0032660CA2